MNNYEKMKEIGMDEAIEIRIKYQRKVREVEFFDGIRLDPQTIPSGKHLYHTRHDDYGNLSTPASIAPEGQSIRVNFCGSIVTDEPISLPDESDITFVNFS